MTDTNQLPPLPTPKFTETIRGVPCITVTEHEHLMRVYAQQALRTEPEFSRIAKRKLDELQKQGFGITGYAIQRGTQRGFITNGGFVGWWRSDEAPSVPDDVVRDAISTVREHYRGTDWGKAAESICDAIDAMLAAKEGTNGEIN